MRDRSHHRKLWMFSLLTAPVLLMALAASPHPPGSVGATQVTWRVVSRWEFSSWAHRVPVWEDYDEIPGSPPPGPPCRFHQIQGIQAGPICFGTNRRVPTRPGEVCN